MARLEWHQDKIMRLAEKQAHTWLSRSGARVKRSAQLSMQGPSPSQPGQPPAVPQGGGTLRRSIDFNVDMVTRTAKVGVAKDSPADKYAEVLEYGGVIESDNLMTVPLNEKAEKLSRSAHGKIGSIGSLRFAVIDGNYYLVDKMTNEPMFILRDKVTIEKRPFMRPALDRERDAILRDLERIKIVP